MENFLLMQRIPKCLLYIEAGKGYLHGIHVLPSPSADVTEQTHIFKDDLFFTGM